MRGLKWKAVSKQTKPYHFQSRQTLTRERDKHILPGANVKNHIDYDHKAQLEDGYSQWISNCQQEGFQVFAVTFVFDGNRTTAPTMRQMEEGIFKYYDGLVSRLYRRPNKKPRTDLPLLIAKADTASIKFRAINGSHEIRLGECGTHYHGVLAIPPRSKMNRGFSNDVAEFAEKKGKSDHSFLLRVNMGAVQSANWWSSYMQRQNNRAGHHFLEDFDILYPLNLPELEGRATTPRRPRPRRAQKIPSGFARNAKTSDANPRCEPTPEQLQVVRPPKRIPG